MNPENNNISLKVFGASVNITAPFEVVDWVKHDYSRYVTQHQTKANLIFNLSVKPPAQNHYNGLTAKGYHKDYIIYEKGYLRVIDFFGKALSIFNKKTKETSVNCPDLDYLYEIFYLAFESLVGEELENKGFTRIHCLALEKNGQANILMLPPGGGKTTLALKFLEHSTIKVLAEDILLYKKGKFYGLNFRWGIREKSSNQFKNRLMKRQSENNKYLIDTTNLLLTTNETTYGNLIIGIRQIGQNCQIIKISKLKMFAQMFKPLVLGLELQQSLAYFLLGNPLDYFLKFRLIWRRLFAIIRIITNSPCYNVFLGNNVNNNFQTLSKFLD